MRKALSSIVLALGLTFAAAPAAMATDSPAPPAYPDTTSFEEMATIPTDCADIYFAAVGYFSQFRLYSIWQWDQYNALNTHLEDVLNAGNLDQAAFSDSEARAVQRTHHLRDKIRHQRATIKRLREQLAAAKHSG